MEENCRGLIEAFSRNFAGGTNKTTEDLRIADIPVEIRTEHFSNISLVPYHQANPLGDVYC
jgi:hypothetical protein